MKLLFTSTPMVGHFYPMLPLIRAAQAQGHEVAVATGPDLATEVERLGIPAWPIGPTMAEALAEWRRGSSTPAENHLEALKRDAIAIFIAPGIARAKELLPLAEDWRPEIVIHEMAEGAGWEVGAALGALIVGHTYGPMLANGEALFGLACELMAAELGSPNRLAAIMNEPLVDIWPSRLQTAEPIPNPEVLPIRPAQPTSAAEDPPPADLPALPFERSIYATFGTVFATPELFTAVLAAIRDLTANVIMTTGSGIDPAALGPVPDHVVVLGFVPQQQIMARCAAVVSHAGSGTVLGAIAARLPQVCIPIGADQHVNAAQVAAAGAGIAVPPDERTPERIRAAIEGVLNDPGYAAAAGRLQDEIQAMPAPTAVLDQLVAMVESQRGG